MTAARLRDRAILIVEDEFLIALEASEILEGCGARIIGPAYRIQEALALIQASQVDMALIDVNLHGELSEPVVSALRAKGIPIALTTGYGRKLPFPFEGPVLPKPYSPDELIALMGALDTPTEGGIKRNFA